MISEIEDWQLHTLSDGTQVFTGTVVKDIKGRFLPGDHMRSSPIMKFNRETGILQTRNSTYKMDMKTEGMDVFFDHDLGDGVKGIFY